MTDRWPDPIHKLYLELRQNPAFKDKSRSFTRARARQMLKDAAQNAETVAAHRVLMNLENQSYV